jgi:AraC-like DNA-binding protein
LVQNPNEPFRFWAPQNFGLRTVLFFGDLANDYGAGEDDDNQFRLDRSRRISMTTGWGGILHRQIALLWSEIDRGSPIANSPVLIASLEDSLGILLLKALGKGGSPKCGSIQMERAREFIEEHLAMPLRLRDIAQASCTSVSALTRNFQSELGISPIAYVQLRRMLMARRMLLRAEFGQTTVTQIATNCGITHLSRFAQTYRTRYGELPSETLNRRSIG